jgi:aryl-alcohol dehydrogenase-like predicted oxidoreductase
MVNAYALAHKRADFLVIGPITIEQLRRTVASLKLSKMLKPEDLDYLYYGDE